MKKKLYTVSQIADMLSVSKQTVRNWDISGKLKAIRHPSNDYRLYHEKDVLALDKEGAITNFLPPIRELPLRQYNAIELFAGAGGLALGLENAGLKSIMLNEIDKHACNTLRNNRPNWNIIEGDIKNIDFKPYKGKVDVITGGFPCQSFSYAGKKLGFEDTRGTLFYEFVRAINETKPLICVGENVRGLLNHDKGMTLESMLSILHEIGYNVMPPRILKAIFHRVPQKRERLLIVGIRSDIKVNYEFPRSQPSKYTLKDALRAGQLFNTDVPNSKHMEYSKRKKEILQHVPQGGYWKDLPLDLQKEYMQKSFYLGGGKTGMARRMSWDDPCLTLTCSPAQKQTERCHPDETRPFTIREYARIQTFPDNWKFEGPITSQYKQIGNAVPVNLAEEIGYTIIKALNDYHKAMNAHNNLKYTFDNIASIDQRQIISG
jgi:DNA (cytosine-5)-methyltransferase 1